MTRLVILDASPVGLLTLPPERPAAIVCWRWLNTITVPGIGIVVPEIIDYEVRRELIRLGNTRSLERLDGLLSNPGINYLPITSRAMRLAAHLWAEARRTGAPPPTATPLTPTLSSPPRPASSSTQAKTPSSSPPTSATSPASSPPPSGQPSLPDIDITVPFVGSRISTRNQLSGHRQQPYLPATDS